MNDNISDLYADRLLSSFGSLTSTGLSELSNGLISHDKITRFLSRKPGTSAELRSAVRPLIRQIESPDGVLIIDDSIPEKPPTDGNDIICRHYDHCSGGSVRGISFMTALYCIRDIALPISFQIIAETEYYIDPEDGEEKRRCPVPKNKYAREMIKQSAINRIPFRYVLTDVRSASAENMMFIRHDVKKDSVMPVRTDRKTALSHDDRRQGRYVGTGSIDFRTDNPTEIFPEDADFPMLPVKQVFVNRDGSTGTLYLVSSDITMTYEQITATYRKRRNVECCHKSLEQNVSSEKSPAEIVSTQKNHFSASLCGCVRLEMFRISGRLNHSALKAGIYISALRSAFSELQKLQPLKITA